MGRPGLVRENISQHVNRGTRHRPSKREVAKGALEGSKGRKSLKPQKGSSDGSTHESSALCYTAAARADASPGCTSIASYSWLRTPVRCSAAQHSARLHSRWQTISDIGSSLLGPHYRHGPNSAIPLLDFPGREPQTVKIPVFKHVLMSSGWYTGFILF